MGVTIAQSNLLIPVKGPAVANSCTEFVLCVAMTTSSASIRKLASAVGAKSARACDSCVMKRARWYCAADDAFLCQSCDSSVHSANPLTKRHQRVRLKTGPFDESNSKPNLKVSVPTWHQGFTRKARTPRLKRHAKSHHNHHHHHPQPLVPEICSDEQSREEENEELLFRVPIFDPLVPSEMDLDEFAADVECLLGRGLEDESFNMEGLGLLESNEFYLQCERRNFELNFDDLGAGSCEEKETKSQQESRVVSISNTTFLKLDFSRVMSDWNGQNSPWINGERPEINAGEFSTDFFRTSVKLHRPGAVVSGRTTAVDREVRVSRYREKRRTRLFAKKIRYEVRKLNAEKRPRMKGRFVKRSNFQTPANFGMAE